MTAEQHRDIGRLLGIPDCCIDAFNRREQVHGHPVLRGPCRTREECETVNAAVLAILGWPYGWDTTDDPRRAHVPCYDCFTKVFCGTHPDGWVFEDDHDRICDQDHTHASEAVIRWLDQLQEMELSL